MNSLTMAMLANTTYELQRCHHTPLMAQKNRQYSKQFKKYYEDQLFWHCRGILVKICYIFPQNRTIIRVWRHLFSTKTEHHQNVLRTLVLYSEFIFSPCVGSMTELSTLRLMLYFAFIPFTGKKNDKYMFE